MAFSPFDRKLLEEGLAYFSRPRLASLLEMLGASDTERVATLVTMLRHAPAFEFEEAVDLFERAVARAERHRRWDDDKDPDAESRAAREEERRRRRYSPSAERREQRRRGERLEG